MQLLPLVAPLFSPLIFSSDRLTDTISRNFGRLISDDEMHMVPRPPSKQSFAAAAGVSARHRGMSTILKQSSSSVKRNVVDNLESYCEQRKPAGDETSVSEALRREF